MNDDDAAVLIVVRSTTEAATRQAMLRSRNAPQRPANIINLELYFRHSFIGIYV